MMWVLFYSALMLIGAGLLALRCYRVYAADESDMRDITDHGWCVWGFCISVVLTLFAVGIPLFATSDRITCRNTAANLDLPYRWSFSAGCYFQLPDGSWWPSDNIRNIDGQLRTGEGVEP